MGVSQNSMFSIRFYIAQGLTHLVFSTCIDKNKIDDSDVFADPFLSDISKHSLVVGMVWCHSFSGPMSLGIPTVCHSFFCDHNSIP